MKKTLLLLLAVFAFFTVNNVQAQDVKETLLSDFESGWPANVTLLDLDGRTPHPQAPQTRSWGIFTMDNINFFALSNSYFTSPGKADDWMIFSDLELGEDAEKIFLIFDAMSYTSQYPETLEILIDTTNTVEPDSFVRIHNIAQVNGDDWREYAVELSEYAGQTVSIAFRCVSNDKLYLLVDNVELVETSVAISASVSVVDNNPYVTAKSGGTVAYRQSIRNTGTESIRSITYVVSNGVDSDTIERSAINIPSMQTRAISINIPSSIVKAPGGAITIKMVGVNGEEYDGGELSQRFSVIDEDNAFQKVALSEMFTASSCPPCKPGNERFMSIVDNQIDQDVHYIKYQQDFPGNGDPYTTDELIARRGFYGINAVPELRVDGISYVENPNSMTVPAFKTALEKKAFAEFNDVQYWVDAEAQTVTVKGSYTLLSEVIENSVLMAAVVEDTTFKNVSTNGQTYFLGVVKKLLAGNEGIAISTDTELGVEEEFEFTYEFKGNYRKPANGLQGNRINHNIEHSVENFDRLSVSVWIENKDVQFILNSAKAENKTASKEANVLVNEVKVYPHPATDYTSVDINVKEAIDAEVYIINMNGQRVKNIHGGTLYPGVNTLSADVSDLAPGRYIIEMRGKNLYYGTPLIIVR